MTSPQNKLAWLEDELADWESSGLQRAVRTRTSGQGAEIELDGRRFVNFGSNDYLGLASDPRVVSAAVEAARQYGWGSGASPAVAGRSAWHDRLERELADFEQTEAAITFPTGYAANVAAITSLVGRPDAIYSDRKNHASIIDGCRLSGAAVHIYAHRDVEDLVRLLEQGGPFRRRLIVSDSLFSMDGDLAPLPELAEAAERFGCLLMVDEAHATGVFGEMGRGVSESQSVEERIDVRVGTLSKAIGSAGGFVCGGQPLIAWLRQRARSYVFSTAAPAPVAAASLAALGIIRQEPLRRRELLQRAEALREALTRQGWNIGDGAGPIVPIYIGPAGRTIALAERLASQGIFAPGIRPPTVPQGESLLRISLSYAHTLEMIERLISALAAERTPR